MAKLPFKAIVRLKPGDFVLPPSGILSKQVSKEELESNPEKYINTHSNFYENADEIKYYLATRNAQKKEGEKVKFIKGKDKSGNTFNILARNKKKLEAAKKTSNPQQQYLEMLAKKKASNPVKVLKVEPTFENEGKLEIEVPERLGTETKSKKGSKK